MESKGESSHERNDRHWRRWRAFIKDWGLGSDDLLLDSISGNEEQLLLARGFLMACRMYNFDRQEKLATERTKPMVSLRDALSSVASTFRGSGRPSPFHIPNGVHGQGSMIHPKIRSILRGRENKDPLPNRQKALTPPAFLIDMHRYNQQARIRKGVAAYVRLDLRSLILCNVSMQRVTRPDKVPHMREHYISRAGRRSHQSRRP